VGPSAGRDKFGFGFAWVLMPADPEAKRCREIPREEGIDTIREEWESDQESIILAGTMIGSMFDVEVAHLTSSLANDNTPVDLSETFDLLSRVCERVKAIQLEDGSKCFDADDTSCVLFASVVGIGLKEVAARSAHSTSRDQT
jgi:hypothetical protein